MANIGTSLKNWSTTEASNQPDGADTATIVGDLRAIQSGVRYLRANDTIASASTCDLGSKDAEYLSISGTTSITALGTVSAGIVKRVVFEGALTLTHNNSSLILPSGSSIVTAAGDCAEFVSLGSGNWRCTNYQKANGTSIVSVSDGDKGDITVSSSGATWTIDNDAVTFAKMQNIATSRLLGRTTAGSGDVEELTVGSGLTLSGGSLTGKLGQVVTSASGTLATGTTTIPADNTIPQITEGDQYLSVSITPTSASSTLEIDVTINLSSTSSSVTLTAALFQDSTANALAAASSSPTGSNYIQCITFKHFMTAGTTSATTFRVRAGGSSAGTTAVNGWSGTQFYGGVLSSRITVKEILP